MKNIDKLKKMKNNRLTIKKLVMTSLFAAISCILVKFEFPILPSASYLKFDLSDTFLIFICLNGFIFSAFFCAILKSLFTMLPFEFSFWGQYGGVAGFIADLIGGLTIVGFFGLVYFLFRSYKLSKNKKFGFFILSDVIFTGIATIILVSANALFLLNMFGINNYDWGLLWTLVTFNVIKFAISSILGTLLWRSSVDFMKTISN